MLDPVALLKTIRGVQQELLALSNHEINAAAPAQPEYFDAFATAWHSDYRARPKSGEDDHQALVENPRRSVRGELAVGGRLADGEPNLTAKELLTRLSQRSPDLHPRLNPIQ